MSEKKSILEKISEGQVWKSIFRGGGVPTTRRQRMMVVLNSVFLHLHPVRLPKHAVKLKFTWCMGGFILFPFSHPNHFRNTFDVLLQAYD